MIKIFAILLNLFVFPVYADTIKIATAEWPPYSSRTLAQNGSSLYIIKKALEKVGHQADFVFLPWARALGYAKSSKVNAIAPIFKTAKRESFLSYSDGFETSQLIFLKRKGTNVFLKKENDIEKYTLGLVKGYKNTEKIDSNSKIRKDYVVQDLSNLKKLNKSHIDITIIDKNVSHLLISNNKKILKNNLVQVGNVQEVKRIYLAFSIRDPKSARYLEDFNRGLRMIKNDIPKMIDYVYKINGISSK